MALTAGSHCGPYEISAKIGAGGMGEVYRARDTKLDRDVALKILPEAFASDPERLARFEREAKILAALNHPHIAHIHGLEESDGVKALVMELVEGPTLADRIAQGAIPLDDALPIARQIAEALEAAHEQGIIHRDLKPANIKVRSDGTVKVLDFGLAKALDPPAASRDVAQSPTITSPAMTQAGMILGTAAYMSPEQVKGRTADMRADIWAFGVVLFEMLSGRRPFDDDAITAVMARVLEREPDWTLLPATVPPSIRALIERCLAKDPKARLRDIGDARHAIGEVLAGRTGTIAAAGSPRASRRAWVPWALAGGLAAIAAAGWLRPGAATDTPKRLVRVEIALPENVEFYTSPRISRDARRIAFIGVREGTRAVYVRDLDQALAKPVRGTDGSIFVTFSPDGQSIGTIAADAKLRKIALDSGTTEELASGVDIVGGLTWTADGQLLYGAVTKLLAVPAAGGAPRELVSVRGDETTISNPSTTPDGKTLLFTSWAGTPGALRARIEAAPMGGGARHVVVDDGGYVLAATPDRLLFQRTGAIYSVAFDAGRVQTTGAPMKVTDEARDSPTGGVAADVTPAGDILFADVHTFNSRLAWVSVEGGIEQTIPAIPRAYYNPRLSPDSHTVAYSDASTIWTTDTVRGAQSRIFVGRDALTGFPIWSHDGAYVFFRTSSGIARLRADGEGAMTLIPGSMRSDYPNAISPDGSTLLMTRISATTSGDIALPPIKGGTRPTRV